MRSWRPVLAFVVLLVVVALIAGDPDPDDGAPLAPDATGPAGAKAAVLLLEELGAEVEVDDRGGPDPSAETALLLEDALDDARRDDLLSWVEDGGTLLVADPRSVLTPPVAEPLGGVTGTVVEDLDRGECAIAGLGDAEEVRPTAGVLYEPTGPACFDDERGAFIVEQAVGAGRIVAVGAPAPFTNDSLDDADHAVVLAGLLAPEGDETVAFIVAGAPAGPGDGDEDLVDLVPVGVLAALVQLAIAYTAYVAFRARRAGRPVAEPLPSELAGSELVAAVGHLLQQERHPDRAAARLRADLRRSLARRLGLPPDAGTDDLVAAAERAGADPDRLRTALDERPVESGEALTELARAIDVTRREVLHEQH